MQGCFIKWLFNQLISKISCSLAHILILRLFMNQEKILLILILHIYFVENYRIEEYPQYYCQPLLKMTDIMKMLFFYWRVSYENGHAYWKLIWTDAIIGQYNITIFIEGGDTLPSMTITVKGLILMNSFCVKIVCALNLHDIF